MSEKLFKKFAVDEKLKFKECINTIMNSIYFRKLADKTQVIISLTGPNVRTRLTHTVEVARIARDLSKELGLNEDLAEAIALAHDIGHTPFGHVGERTLKEIMCGCNTFKNTIKIKPNNYGFKHNLQSALLVKEIFEDENNFERVNYIFWGVAAHSNMTWAHKDSGHDNEILIHCDHCEKVYNCDFNSNEKQSESCPEEKKCKHNFKDYKEKNINNHCSPWICARILNSNSPEKLEKVTRCITECDFVDFWSYRSENYNKYQYFKYLFDFPFFNYYYVPYFYDLLINHETDDHIDFVSFEAVVVNIADEIAQRRQDFEDGIQQKLIDVKEGLQKLNPLILESESLYKDVESNELFKLDIERICSTKDQIEKLSEKILEYEKKYGKSISRYLLDVDKGITKSNELIKDREQLDIQEIDKIRKFNEDMQQKTKEFKENLEKLKIVDPDYFIIRQKQISELGQIIVDFFKAIFLLKIKKVYIQEHEECKSFKPNRLYETFFNFLATRNSGKDFIKFEKWYIEFPWENFDDREKDDIINKEYFLKDYLDRLIKGDNNQIDKGMVDIVNKVIVNNYTKNESGKKLNKIKVDLDIKNLINIQEIIDNKALKKRFQPYLRNAEQSRNKAKSNNTIYFDDLNSLDLIKYLYMYKKLYNINDWEKEGFNAFKKSFLSNANQALMRFVVFEKKEEYNEKKFKDAMDTFEGFYKDLILKSESVEKNDGKSAFIIRRLFKGYISNPHQLPDKVLERIWKDIKPFFIDDDKLKVVFDKIHDGIKKSIGKKGYPRERLLEITFEKPEPKEGWERYPKEICELGKATKKLKKCFKYKLEELKIYQIREILNNPVLKASEDWNQVLYRGITNHIASLTDREALSEYEKLYFTTVELS